MAAELKMGIIGCGGITQSHLTCLLATGRVAITALADPSEASRKARKGAFGQIAEAKEYEDYRDMLSAGGLDAVLIASPHTCHADQIADSLDAGLHVLSEKPMTVTVAEAQRVMKAEKRSGKVLLVAYQRHYAQTYRYIRKAVASGELGKLNFIQAAQCQEWRRIVTSPGWEWRADPKMSGAGQLTDSASHLMDIMLWTTGERPATVWAQSDNRGLAVDVNSSVMMRTDNDVLVTIAVIGDAPNFRESIYVVGDTGAVYLEGGKVYHKVSPWEEMREISDEPAPWFGKAFDRDSNFVGCILDGDENESPSEGALRVAALTEAILASAKAGGEGIKVTWPEI